ncbi:MAG: zf-HC2 domain-containing protein [candidate division NC10 bacterium]|nr:zf-HC2 domain-containing protein [candidate division NC10 bacterium]
MECHDVQERFSGYFDGDLSDEERTSVASHLNRCPICQEEWERFRKTVSLISMLGELHAPEGFAARVLERVDQRPWRKMVQTLFFPLHVKLPLEAFALVILALGGALLYLRSPELQRAVQEPAVHEAEAPSEVRPGPLASPPPASKEKMPPPSAPGLMGRERSQPKDEPTGPLVGPQPSKKAESLEDVGASEEEHKAGLQQEKLRLESRDEASFPPAPESAKQKPAEVPARPSARAMPAPARQEEQTLGAGPPPSVPKTAPEAKALAPAPMTEAEAQAPSVASSEVEQGTDVVFTLKVADVGQVEGWLKEEIVRLGGRAFEEVGGKRERLRGDIRTSRFILPAAKYPALKEAMKGVGQVDVEQELFREGMAEVVVQVKLMSSTP